MTPATHIQACPRNPGTRGDEHSKFPVSSLPPQKCLVITTKTAIAGLRRSQVRSCLVPRLCDIILQGTRMIRLTCDRTSISLLHLFFFFLKKKKKKLYGTIDHERWAQMVSRRRAGTLRESWMDRTTYTWTAVRTNASHSTPYPEPTPSRLTRGSDPSRGATRGPATARSMDWFFQSQYSCLYDVETG